MSKLMMLAGLLLAYGGLCAISSTMDRHYCDRHGRGDQISASHRWRGRMLGWLGVAGAFAACVASSGWHAGPVLWCGVLSASALLLTLLLHYAPHHAMRLCLIGHGAALICAGLWLISS